MTEQRKEVRLNIPDASLLVGHRAFEVINLSYSGIKINHSFPVGVVVKGQLVIQDHQCEVEILIVNQCHDNCGGSFVNHQETTLFLDPWFNPHVLIGKLKPKKNIQGLSYEDLSHNCKFNFSYGENSQIKSIEISFHNNKLFWDSHAWHSFSGESPDLILDEHKVKLAKEMVIKTTAFPQSFKEWLLDLV